MRVADYVFRFLADHGVRHVFLVTGGGAMFLNDALGREKRIQYICNHHEQACAIAAEGYVRAGEKLGVVSVTTGPGGTNAMTGLIGAWLDSIPVLYLSGQVKFETTVCSCPELGLRQLGDQEINIIDLVKPVTKYAAMVTDPLRIRAELETAVHHALSGRPGPVWLDIPANVQGALIREEELIPSDIGTDCHPAIGQDRMDAVLEALKKSRRPLFIAGHGIAIAGAQAAFRELIRRLGVPAVTTFCGMALLDENDPLYAGRIGSLGQRAGNFVLQNADLVISVGSRNNVRQVSFNWQDFARGATKVSVDIDEAELKKKLFVPDIPICADAGEFIRRLSAAAAGEKLPDFSAWRRWCAERRRLLPPVSPEQEAWQDKVNPYFFMRELTRALPADADIVAGNGTACVALFQSGEVKLGQKIFWNSGCAAMGYDLPAAIGACVGSGRTTVCLSGDGSFMMNMQELQTIIHHRLPIKLFLLDNDGYGSIKQTQTKFFGPDRVGCDAASGVSFPDFLKLGECFGFKVFELTDQRDLRGRITAVLETPGPVFCVVRMPSFLEFTPKVSSKRLPDGRMESLPLEDMFPFLDREEFARHMLDQ